MTVSIKFTPVNKSLDFRMFTMFYYHNFFQDNLSPQKWALYAPSCPFLLSWGPGYFWQNPSLWISCSQYYIWGLVLWYSGVSMPAMPVIPYEHEFESCVLHFWSSFLLMEPGKKHKMAPVLGPFYSRRTPRGVPASSLWSGLALAISGTWQLSQCLEELSSVTLPLKQIFKTKYFTQNHTTGSLYVCLNMCHPCRGVHQGFSSYVNIICFMGYIAHFLYFSTNEDLGWFLLFFCANNALFNMYV